MDIIRVGVADRYSEMAIYGGVVYLAGQVATNESEGIKEQMQNVLNQIDLLLAEANSDKSRILRAEVYLKTMDDFILMNSVWDEWVSDIKGNAPPRATVEAALAKSSYKVEVVITAAQR